MPAFVSIGDFARASHFSVKALRHYHRLGLLVPIVDARSGYRRYAVEQFAAAAVIRRLRDLDMPLETIRDVLGAPDLRTRNRLMSEHLSRLECDLARTRAAVASLRDLLDGPPSTLSIEHRRDDAIAAAVVADTVSAGDLRPWFSGALGELFATLESQDIAPAGAAGCIIEAQFFTVERGELTVFVPAAGGIREVGRVRSRVLPAVELATTVHAGSDDDIDRAYGSLATYVAESAIGIEGPIRERYIVGRHETADEREWRTEIGWPIFRTAGVD